MMAKKVKNGNNKKLHSKLMKQKKNRVADKKEARAKRLKEMYALKNANEQE